MRITVTHRSGQACVYLSGLTRADQNRDVKGAVHSPAPSFM
jgi:hypothetical protein